MVSSCMLLCHMILPVAVCFPTSMLVTTPLTSLPKHVTPGCTAAHAIDMIMGSLHHRAYVLFLTYKTVLVEHGGTADVWKVWQQHDLPAYIVDIHAMHC